MTTTQDTEIILGAGKMLGLFFGLVILCAIFFGMGFSLGKNSSKAQNGDLPSAATVVSSTAKRPPASNASEARQTPDMTFYKSVDQNNADPELSSKTATPPDAKSNPTDPTASPISNGYYVQVAAVSKQEDADALVDALKKKQYPATASQTSLDKLFHVQVGPFAAIKDAEGMRAQLLSDGYNPILKK